MVAERERMKPSEKKKRELSRSFRYQVNADGKTCKISAISTLKDTHVVIPEKMGDYPVREICAGAFRDLKRIESVVIPTQIVHIGDYAFKGCKSLKAIHYNGTKKEWKQIALDKEWRTDSFVKKIECTDGTIKFLF